LKTVSGKDFAPAVGKARLGAEASDWQSSYFYAKSGNPARVSVPIHGNASLKVGLLKHLLKISDLSEDDL
jgi:hypothetical protein